MQVVAVRAHAAVAQQVAGILVREQVFAGGHRQFVVIGQLGLKRVIQRVADLFVPEQVVLLDRFGVRDTGLQIEAAVGVDRQSLAVTHHFEHRFDAANIFVQRHRADLHLDHVVATIQIALHFGLEFALVLARVVIATRRIHPDLVIGHAIAITIGKQAIQRLAFDLRHRVPHRHVDGADRYRTLAMPAGFFVGHQGFPDGERIEVIVLMIDQSFRVGFGDPRQKAIAHQRALTVATVGVEAVTDDRFAVANHVRNDRDDRAGHLRKVDVGIGDRGSDGDGFFTDIDDTHDGFLLLW